MDGLFRKEGTKAEQFASFSQNSCSHPSTPQRTFLPSPIPSNQHKYTHSSPPALFRASTMEQDPSKTPSLEERHKQLKDGQRKLVELAKTNSTIDHVKKELQEVKGVIREKRLDRGANGRWRRSESPRDPSPNVSDLAHSPPSPLSSNESSVDVYTAAEHKRPETIPPKILKDEVQVVQDSSDREDDPSSGDDAGKNEDAVQGPDGIQTLKSGAQQRMEPAQRMTIEQKGIAGLLTEAERDEVRDDYAGMWSPPRPGDVLPPYQPSEASSEDDGRK